MENFYFFVSDNIQEITKLISINQAYEISSSNERYKQFIYFPNNHSCETIHSQDLNRFHNLICIELLYYHHDSDFNKHTNIRKIKMSNRNYYSSVLSLKKLTQVEYVQKFTEKILVNPPVSLYDKIHLSPNNIHNSNLRIITADYKFDNYNFMFSLNQLERITTLNGMIPEIINKLINFTNLTYLHQRPSNADHWRNKYISTILPLSGLQYLKCNNVKISKHLNRLTNLQILLLRQSTGLFKLTNVTKLTLRECDITFKPTYEYSNLKELKLKHIRDYPETYVNMITLTKLELNNNYNPLSLFESDDSGWLNIKESIVSLTNLQDLILNMKDKAPSGRKIINLNTLTRIRKLCLISSSYKFKISKLNQLTHLIIQGHEPIGMSMLTSLINLKKDCKKLNYSNCINIEVLNGMKKSERNLLSKLTRLKELKMNFVKLQNIELKRLINLTYLHFWDKKYEHTLKDIKQLKILTNLKVLKINKECIIPKKRIY